MLLPYLQQKLLLLSLSAKQLLEHRSTLKALQDVASIWFPQMKTTLHTAVFYSKYISNERKRSILVIYLPHITFNV